MTTIHTDPTCTHYVHSDHRGDAFSFRENTSVPPSTSGAYILTAQRTDRTTVYVGMSRADLLNFRDALNAVLLGDTP